MTTITMILLASVLNGATSNKVAPWLDRSPLHYTPKERSTHAHNAWDTLNFTPEGVNPLEGVIERKGL